MIKNTSNDLEKLANKDLKPSPSAWVKNELSRAKNLSDISDLINFANERQTYQIVHLGICSLDGVSVKDTIYSCSITDTGLSLADFPEDLKWNICQEAEYLLRPFDLLTHEFETVDSHLFADVRKLALMSGLKQLMIIPMKVKNTTSVLTVNFSLGDFEEHASVVLPRAYQFLVTVFDRFPKLLSWPKPGKLTRREVEILTLSAQGFTEACIAKTCGISINTVRNHVENSKVKLNARNKLHAVMIAAETHEIEPILDAESLDKTG